MVLESVRTLRAGGRHSWNHRDAMNAENGTDGASTAGLASSWDDSTNAPRSEFDNLTPFRSVLCVHGVSVVRLPCPTACDVLVLSQ